MKFGPLHVIHAIRIRIKQALHHLTRRSTLGRKAQRQSADLVLALGAIGVNCKQTFYDTKRRFATCCMVNEKLFICALLLRQFRICLHSFDDVVVSLLITNPTTHLTKVRLGFQHHEPSPPSSQTDRSRRNETRRRRRNQTQTQSGNKHTKVKCTLRHLTRNARGAREHKHRTSGR